MSNELNCTPNNSQLGVSLVAYHNLMKTTQSARVQFFKIGPGLGKSRVTLATVTLLRQKDPSYNKIYVWFHHRSALKAETKRFDILQRSMPHCKVKQTLNLQAKSVEIDEKTIVIIDEADDYIIDRRLPIPEKARVLCLSATDFGRVDSKEQEYIKFLKLTVTDSKIPNPLDSDDPPTKVDDYAEFFERAKHYPSKIIYLDVSDVHKVNRYAKAVGYHENEIKHNCEDPEIYKQVGHRVLLIYGEIGLTRGIDYRNKAGIASLIAHPFPNRRGYIQFNGRVGRNGERKHRF